MFFVTAKKLSSNLGSPHFLMFSEKCCECKFGNRDAHGKSRNGHGKFIEKYFVKYVGTLSSNFEYCETKLPIPDDVPKLMYVSLCSHL